MARREVHEVHGRCVERSRGKVMNDERDQRKMDGGETGTIGVIGKHAANNDREWKQERRQLRCDPGLPIACPDEIRADDDQTEKTLALGKQSTKAAQNTG